MINWILIGIILISILLSVFLRKKTGEPSSFISVGEIVFNFYSFCFSSSIQFITFLILPLLMAVFIGINSKIDESIVNTFYITIPILMSVLENTDIEFKLDSQNRNIEEFIAETNMIRLYGFLVALFSLVLILFVNFIPYPILLTIVYIIIIFLYLQFILIILLCFKRKSKLI